MGKYKWAIAAGTFLILLALLCYRKPSVDEVAYESLLWDLSKTDSLLVDGKWDDRQVGYVNLEQFKKLAEDTQYFDHIDDKVKGDSIKFIAKDIKVFFGTDNVLSKCKNLKISIDTNSFTAEVKKIEGVKYIYIPYHILVSVAGWSGSSDSGN